MLQSLQRAIQLRAFVVFILAHAGLIAGVYALARLSAFTEIPSSLQTTLWIAIGTLYLSFVLTIFFIVWPILPWIRRARQLMEWKSFLLKELPEIIRTIQGLVKNFRSGDGLASVVTAAAAAAAASQTQAKSRVSDQQGGAEAPADATPDFSKTKSTPRK